MRKWMNIFENTVSVPSFVDRVTDDLLDEIIATGKWVHHGGDIQDQWDGGVLDYNIEDKYPELIGKDFADVRHLPVFREVLRINLLGIAKDQYERLINGSSYDKLGPLTPDSFIYRGISSHSTKESLGVYWSQIKTQSLHRFIDDKSGGLLFVAQVKDVTIDWEQTIRSRLDLSNGGDEAEIQLVGGSPVKCKVFRVSYPATSKPRSIAPMISNLGYTFKKA